MNSEVDVFLIPHIRMKQLVKETSNQVFGTDFSDDFAVEGLLHSLNHTFHEFKHHEEIENQYILAKLKSRVVKSELLDILCNIHHDTHVKDILSLVKKAVTLNGNLQRSSFKVELQNAVKEFIDDFLPHMEEEEEIFQPLLSTYFTRSELQNLRQQILHLHTLTSDDERQSEPTSAINQENPTLSDSEFSKLPNELLLQIFSYLSPRDLCCCAQVCRQWSEVSWDGLLWQQLRPVRWIFRDDWRMGMDEYEHCTCNDGSCEDKNQWDRESFFSGSDSLDSGESYEEEIDQRRLELATNQENNIKRLVLMARYLIRAVGDHVKVLVLGCCPGLTNGLVYKMLSYCKNLEHLDLSQNIISDLGLNGLFRKNGGRNLRRLDLSGCAKITDKTLKKLSVALTPRVTNDRASSSGSGDEHSDCCQDELISITHGLRYLSLSGCYQITDEGIRVLSKNGNLKNLTHLDLSGCLNLSARGLQDLVVNCPSLHHESFFYCDNISEGPYPDTASGCQNLECTRRVCCRSGLQFQ